MASVPAAVSWWRRGAAAAALALAGGFGSGVLETLSDAGVAASRVLRVGLPDRYVTHGAAKLLHEEVGFTGERIAERVEAAVTESSQVPT